MIAVLAGNYREFLSCKKEMQDNNLVYICRKEQCWGKSFTDCIEYGTYYLNPSNRELKQEINIELKKKNIL